MCNPVYNNVCTAVCNTVCNKVCTALCSTVCSGFCTVMVHGGATMQLFGKAPDDNGIFTNADKNATVCVEDGQTEIYLNT